MAETTLPAAPPRRVRRLWLVAVCVLVPAALRGLIYYADQGADLGEINIFTLMMLFQFALLLGLLGLVVWFFLLSGLAAKVRLAGVGLLVAVVGGLFLTVRKIEFDGQMNPRFYYRWDADHDRQLAAFRASAAKAEGVADLTSAPADSPSFRYVAATKPFDTDWVAKPPKILWKQPGGGGHSGFAVAGNGAVTVEQVGDEERVVCFDRATGKERWAYAYPAKFSHTEPMGGSGPRATPTVAGGDVYSLGGAGDLVCLNGADGSLKWKVNVLADNDAENVEWGMSGSPLIVGPVVVVNPGTKKELDTGPSALAAYDRTTGKKKWVGPGGRAGYASPVAATLAGKEQILVFDASGLSGYDPAAGNRLWHFPWKSPMDMNSAQPVVVGPNRVLVSSEKDNGTALLEVTESGGAWEAKSVWKTKRFAARYTTPVFSQGYFYGLADGRMVCFDAGTGEVKWKDGSFGNGQILPAGNSLVVTAEKGSVHLVAADPTEFRELGSLKVFTDRTWNTPALAGNQLFVRNHREMAGLELPAR